MYPHQKVFVIPPLHNQTFYDCHGPGECKTNIDGIPGGCPPCLTVECLDNCMLVSAMTSLAASCSVIV